MKFSVILFDGFQTLDAFGPVEVIGKLEKFYELGYFLAKQRRRDERPADAHRNTALV